MNKLEPIAKVIKEILENSYSIEAKYSFEQKKDWLPNVPNRNLYNKFWDEISFVYSNIVDNKWTIDEKIKLVPQNKLTAMARIDIWFEEPYNFICEFDETQHFNQFRLRTLESSYDDFRYSFNYNHYFEICKSRVLEPGTSGFCKLRTQDNLFPQMFSGEKQDNRLRQRAFRDFLKDIVPVKLGFNPTVRISNKVTNGNIKDFTSEDLSKVRLYMIENNLLEKITVQ